MPSNCVRSRACQFIHCKCEEVGCHWLRQCRLCKAFDFVSRAKHMGTRSSRFARPLARSASEGVPRTIGLNTEDTDGLNTKDTKNEAARHRNPSVLLTFKVCFLAQIQEEPQNTDTRSKRNCLSHRDHRGHRGRMASLSVNSVTSVANLLVAASGSAGHSVVNSTQQTLPCWRFGIVVCQFLNWKLGATGSASAYCASPSTSVARAKRLCTHSSRFDRPPG